MMPESNLTTDNSENGLVLIAFLLSSILTKADVYILQMKMGDMIDAIPDFDWAPKFIFSIWEAGYWIVKCCDELSMKWFIEKASKLTPRAVVPNIWNHKKCYENFW